MTEPDWSGTELSVLYDVFYEQGTQLGAEYVSLGYEAQARGDQEELAFWDAKAVALRQERQAVDPNDRDQIISTMTHWLDTLDLVQHLRTSTPVAA